MIAIIDYGLGNVSAFANVYRRLNIPFCLASEPDDLDSARGIILPGVGAFDYALEKLEAVRCFESLRKIAATGRIPVLGVCVGMHMLAKSSEEGRRSGLGWIDGIVRKFDASRLKSGTPLPHMGWNDVDAESGHPLFSGLDDKSRFYFLHSYVFDCEDAADIVSKTNYGSPFVSAVGRGNILGVQFHPEKSHHNGVRLLQNFAQLSMQK